MNDLLTDLVGWIDTLSPAVIYIVLLAIAFGENVLPPIPGDLVIVFAGYLVGLDRLQFFPSVALASLGGAVGFAAMFLIGRRLGSAILAPDRFTWLPKQRLSRGLDEVGRHGYWVVLVNRFLPGLRSVISLSAGMSAMGFWRTMLASAASAVIWSWLMVYAGKRLGENWEYVGVIIRKYSEYFIVVLALLAVVRIVFYVRSRRSGTADRSQNHVNNA
ncbi:MAG: DedA family protein [Rhodothermales bacterium]